MQAIGSKRWASRSPRERAPSERRQYPLEEPAGADREEEPDGDRQQVPEEDGGQRKQERDRERLAEQDQHRAAIAEGIAQVASDHVSEPPRIPGQQRIVEAHRSAVLPQLRDRVPAGAQPGIPLEHERMSGRGPGERECDEGDAQERRNHPQKPPGQRHPHRDASQTSRRSYQITDGRMPRTRLLTASREGRLYRNVYGASS